MGPEALRLNSDEQPEPAANAQPAGATRALLIASADASVRHEAARWLAGAGFEMLASDGFHAALELLASRRPAVVFADAALHDGGGRSLCEALRSHPQTPAGGILALCANHRQRAAALAAGAADVLEKPFDWQLASVRADRLARLAETSDQLGRARDEMVRLRKAVDEERQVRRWLDHFDALTGLPDGERLEHALDNALVSASERSQVAVALFDIEHLVLVNSRLGRPRANSVLQQVAQRLTAALRSDQVLNAMARPSVSMAARMGGGLFAVVLTGLPGAQEARTAVRALLDRLSGRYSAGDEEIVLSASVGVALAPQDGISAETMLQRAELAAAEAVESGGAIRFYGQSGHRVTERSRAVTRLLPTALARGDFRLHYQPLFDGDGTARACGAEALLRWSCAELGEVPPAEFVPLAEEMGLMVPIGTWVLRTVCRQMRSWLDEDLPPSRVSVNVSLCQLMRGDLAEVVREALAETKIDPSLLELELSERGVLRSDPDVLGQMHAVRDLGVRLAIDDFGTGNSAVVYLKQFPIDVLKIDESLVRGVTSSSADAAITSATIAMARQLGLRVVAEGVERQDQMDFLRRHGCSEYQGFLFSPAVSPESFAILLRDGLPRGLATFEGKAKDASC